MPPYIGPGDDVMADEDISADEYNVLGAIARRLGRPMARPPGRGQPFARPPLGPVGAQPNPARMRSYLGFGFVSWVTTDGADKVIIVEPQESFRGERLIIDTTAVGGTAAGLTLLRRIEIGTMPQSPSVEAAAPAVMFARDSTYSALDLQIAYRGTKIQITLGQTVAPGAGVTVTAAVGMFGEWIR